MSVTFKRGDLLKFKDVDAIAHVVNCLCTRPHGLSAEIARLFPWGDVYSRRSSMKGRNLTIEKHRGVPGTIKIFHSPRSNEPKIICLLAQWDFGRARAQRVRHVDPHVDSESNRTMWFAQCLNEMGRVDIKTLGIPFKLGCGLGGQNWDIYLTLIREWAVRYGKHVIIAVK